MKYEKAVEKQIPGETDELNRRKELWREIFTTYENAGEDMIKSVLMTHTDKITEGFEKLLNQLRKKL